MILVTGTSGFIGKHLLIRLIAVYGADNIIALTSAPEKKCKYLLHKNYSFDNDFFKNSSVDIIDTVIHAGAFIPKTSDEANAYDLCFSNIESTKKLLEALPKSVKKFIFVSTVDVYDTSTKISEKTKIEPATLYGHSKYYCERMIIAWAKLRNVHPVILRLGHVYGPGEEQYQKLIPATISKLLKGKPPQIWGEGNEKRSFIYIDDVVEAILNADSNIIDCGVVNIVGSAAYSIRDLIHLLISISNINISPEFIPSDVPRRNLEFDNACMRQRLCVEKWNLQSGLQSEWNYMKMLLN